MTDRARSTAAFLLLVTFVAGAAAGFAASRIAGTSVESSPPEAAAHSGMSGAASGESTIERFADELGLTDEQREQIAPIVAETRARMSALFDEIRPTYGDIVDSARGRIEALLTEEQVGQYRILLEERYGAEPGAFGDRTDSEASPTE